MGSITHVPVVARLIDNVDWEREHVIDLDASDIEYDGQTVASYLANEGDEAFSFTGAFTFKDLGPTSPENGIFFGKGGNSLSFQTRISNPDPVGADTDNQRASVLIAATTSDDGNSEEQTLCILTTIETGLRPDWEPSTAYEVGDNVINATEVYRCTVAGTSAGAGGPTGRGASITDGSVTWTWINDDVLGAKIGIYNETEVKAGAGSAWSQVNNFDLRAGYSGTFAVNTELDISNHSGVDSVLGGLTAYGLWVAAQGTNVSTAGVAITSANTANHALLWGLYFAGTKLASRAAIAVDASAPVGIGFGFAAGGAGPTPAFSTATIYDASTSNSGIILGGTYGSGALEYTGTGPTVLNMGGTATIAAINHFGTATNGMILGGTYATGVLLSGTYSSGAIEFTGTSPVPINIGGTASVAAIQHIGTATYGMIFGGSYTGNTPIIFNLTQVKDAANDAAAAGLGVPAGGLYRNGSVLMVRVV